MFMSNGKVKVVSNRARANRHAFLILQGVGQPIVFLWHHAFNPQAGKIVFF